jgi:hypothetical protein
MIKQSTIFIGMFLLVNGASAADANGDYSYLAQGAESCGKFMDAVNKGNNEQNWISWNNYQAYTYGYFTGVNRYLSNTKNIKGNTDMPGVMAYIEKYCKENPLKDYFDAVDAVQLELYAKRTR